ncbi:S-layer homology domain-containing protein [Geosporobacter subterraneus DSM 17957]|uniref:S-layer homology domain-containing protein n=1 Tax=Geosporobacter subterraneus DSM 17957 TaxID=1121919 RepID=A0A1M6H6R8_9FIRM|nr:S-layer homology domain-containing protein [Geosporobacter subterraneus]SHJ17854.1 S-layer homology domain-containing protein [Geosporobacter subterraneus DSM 17957]
MKSKLKSLLASLVALCMVFMFVSPNMTYADGETDQTSAVVEDTAVEVTDEIEDEDVPTGPVEGTEEDAEDKEGDEEDIEEDEEDTEEDAEDTPEKKLFTDVPENHWAFNVIHELRDKNIVKGMSDTQFAPANQMTRAEFVTLLVNTLELTAEGPSIFEDVSADAWYGKTVQAAFEAGIVKGMSETKFAPNKNITREEMATMILQAYEVKKGEKVEEASEAVFADGEQISTWAKNNVNKVVAVGLMRGRGQDQFAPKGITNRAEGAQVIFNLLNQ